MTPTYRSLRIMWPAALAAMAVSSPAFAQVGGAVVVQKSYRQAEAPPAQKADLDVAPAPTDKPILSLADGGYLAGDLLDSDGPKAIRWQGSAFVEPLEFPLASVNAAHWPSPKEPKTAKGAFCFELAGGDVIYGSLVALDDDSAVIDAPPLGKIKIKRANLHRVDRWSDSADLIYSGPIGLEGWTQPADAKGWRDESGQAVTDQEAATIRGDLKLPPRAALEFELSWKKSPDFALALGVNPSDDKADARAFHLEVWDNKLVAWREVDSGANLAEVQPIIAGPGRVQIQAYLDQESGRLTIVSPGGKPLAELTVPDPQGKPLSGLAITNHKGDIRLERLRIRKWNGEPFREVEANRSRIQKSDGSVLYGKVKSYDAGPDEFVVADDDKETRVPGKEIASVFLSPPGDEPDRPVRVVTQEGARLSGSLEKVESGEVRLSVPGVEGWTRVPVSALRSLVAARHDAAPSDVPKPPDSPSGTLALEGTKLRGHLVPGKAGEGLSALAWKADAATTASPLKPGVSGRIVYREPRPKVPTANMARTIVRVRPAPAAGFVQGVFGGATQADPPQPTGPVSGRKALYLRTGDVVPGEVVTIDEKGVTFKSAISDSTFIPHEKIKAIELAPSPPAINKLTRAKLDRLLTLPRMQKDSPPTQLIRSLTGDYLRARILGMDDKTLKVEVRLENKEIPRGRVSRIIWLHPDELPAKDAEKDKGKDQEKPAAPAPAAVARPSGPTQIQAMRSDGIRLTFAPESFADSTISGKSDVLGACRVKLDEVDQLLIGPEIEKAAAQTAFGPWKLHDAIEPKIATGEDGGESSPGTESALVGKPAPDFTLDLLGDGKKTFHLADARGSVVILDFWATWCGPCLQAMPQVEEVSKEFADQGVKLVAVNLEEGPERIQAMLDRHKMTMTVALDRDGVVALKYQANAIPQTVIIDKDGKVARLYVGANPKLGDNLRAALKEVLSGEKPKEKAEAAP